MESAYAIKCCYAAAGSGTGAEETELRAQLSSKISVRAHKGIVVAKKMSALVHNSRSRSTIVLYSRIRGSS